MSETKRQLELLSFYDHTGIERHLAEMARRGWMIQKMSNYFWTYRRIKPQELRFTVSYFPPASDFDPGPSAAQQTLLDFCGETGWTLACTWFQMQVFYTAAPDPVPIHTEPTLEVAAIHNACRRNYLRIYTLLFILSLIAVLLFLSTLLSDALRLLASPMDLTTGVVCLLLFLYTLEELTTYHAWHRKAKQQAAYGAFLDTPSTAGFQRVLLVLLGLCLAYWLVSLACTGSYLLLGIFLAVLLCMAAISASVHAVKDFLKRRRVPAAANRGLTALAGFLAALLLWSGVIALGVQLFAGISPERLPLYAEPPFTVSDLRETTYRNYVTTVSPDESLFLAQLKVQQRPGPGDASAPDIPELAYTLYRVKIPALYGFCRGQLERQMVLSVFWKGALAESDAAPWGAAQAYHLFLDDGTATGSYLLCYPDLLVRLELSWTPTSAEMGRIGQALTVSP